MIGEHRQERNPGTDLAVILFCQHPRDLRQVAKVVHHPGRQQLTQRDSPQGRVLAGQVQIGL